MGYYDCKCDWCGKTLSTELIGPKGNQVWMVKGVSYRGKKWFCSEKCKTEYKNEHCFITTAVCKSRNLPDDCHELTALRHFRDTYMRNNAEMEAEVREYYEIAPKICESIVSLSNSGEIFDSIYQKWLKSAVNAVDNGNSEQAHSIYKDMVLSLKKEYL